MNIFNKRSLQKGFTTVELMIAISVFSVIILMTTVVITGVGNIFNKGLNQTKTQNSARLIADSVTQQLKNNNQFFAGANGEIKSYCIGNVKYTYVIGKRYGDSVAGVPAPGTVQQVLWRTNNGSSDCTPENIVGVVAPSAGDELVPRNTRLNSFGITCDKGCTVDISETFGTDDYVNGDGTCMQDAGPYCATVTYQTFVTNRL